MSLLLASFWASVSWQGNWLRGKPRKALEDFVRVEWNGGLRRRAGLYYFSYKDEELGRELGVYFFHFGLGKVFRKGSSAFIPWLGFDYAGVEEEPPSPIIANGLGYSAGFDLAWAPSEKWKAQALFTASYRYLPGWFPGSAKHQLSVGFGVRFNALE